MLIRYFVITVAVAALFGCPRGLAQPVDESRTLRVEYFDIEGNTLVPTSELMPLLTPYQGRDLTLAQMKELAAELTNLYQRRGFMLVKAIIPPQSFASRRVTVRVVEGQLGEVMVTGAQHYDPDWIRRRFLASYQQGALKHDDFVRGLLLLNEFSDLKVKATLRPGAQVGKVDALIQVEDTAPFHGGVDYNNYGTPETGANRVGLTFDAGNLITAGDNLSLRGVVGFPARRTNFFQVSFAAPVDDDGTQLSASYQNGAFAVSQGLGAILDVRGNANIYTLAVSRALDRSFDHASNLGLALSNKEISNDFFGGSVPFSRDHYTSARLTYQEDWRSTSGRTLLQAAWTQGLGGTPASDPLVSRAGASGGFGKLNFELARVQNLQPGLYGVVRCSAQWATQPVYLAEQFALGGPDTVRGFSQAELLGDDGYLVSAELRWSPLEDDPDRFQMAFFVDHGGVSLKRTSAGDLPRGNHLTGAGLGFRLGLGNASQARLDVGFPLSPTSDRQGRNPAIYAGLQTRF